MKKNAKTRWFVEPKTAATNAIAMANLLDTCGATEDNIYYNKKDTEGEAHCVIEVDHRFISRMERDQKDLQTKFNVFLQREGAYAMKRWLFRDKKVVRKSRTQSREPITQKPIAQILFTIWPAEKED